MNNKQISPFSSPGLPGEVSAQQTEGVFSPSIPQPQQEPNQHHLPAALTFFLTRKQRTQILRALKALDQNRTAALISALNIK
tara:strand:+ start:447879 stop:448124 length:246 start_codon:yes stop_codon:yes gene_type:complete